MKTAPYMVDLTFIQNSRLGRCVFQLRGDQIEVSWLSGVHSDEIFALRRISLDYDRGLRRFHALYIFPGIVALFGLAGVVLLLPRLNITFVPIPSYSELLQIGGITGATVAGIAGMIWGLPRVEYFQFYDHWHRPLFYFVRAAAQREECDDFVRTLLDQIERVQRGESAPAAGPSPAISSVRLPSAHDAYFVGEIRWQVSLVLGGGSTMLPFIPRLDAILGGNLFFLIFGASVGGMVFAWLSYQAKERYRHVSLIGAVLSFVATLCY